jgi:chorismate dehydratase
MPKNNADSMHPQNAVSRAVVTCLLEFLQIDMRPLRISAISYLNTAPLMWDFEHGRAGEIFNVGYTLPSNCADELQHGTADIGIIPSAAYVTIPGLSILPGVAIASKQAVRSILLVSRKPMAEIRTVALDSSSLTSAALVRILFEKCWGGDRQFSSLPPNLEGMLADHDAALLIGDPALKVDRSQFHTWDLAEEWIRFTGKPFVFAFWAVRQDAAKLSSLDLATIFQESRDHGLELENLHQLARTWAPKLGLSEEDIRQYLAVNIHYYLDEPCLEGLRLFYRYAYECKVLPRAPELHFADAKPALI